VAEESKQEFEQEEATLDQEHVGAVKAHTVEIHQGYADLVQASGDVVIRQGGAKEVHAQEMTIRQGGAVTVDADSVSMVQGGAVIVRTSDADLGPGTTTAAVLADTVKMEQAAAQFMLARDSVEMDQSAAAVLVGQHITAKDSAAAIMIANTVDGNVNVAMDRETAIAFGAAFGAMLGLIMGVFGLFWRRR
jgi:hypothetical protein